jgi:hypothetical protein
MTQKRVTYTWGFDGVLFRKPEIVPVFFRVNGIDYEGAPFSSPLAAPRQPPRLKDAK